MSYSDGIFGKTGPKFVYDSGGESEATVLLDFVSSILAEPEPLFDEYESELTGERDATMKCEHFTVTIDLNLFEYSNAKSKYAEIKAYHGLKVALWEHRDGDAFVDGSNNAADFILREVVPYYFENTNHFYNKLKLVFKSLTPVSRAYGITKVRNLEEIVMSNDF